MADIEKARKEVQKAKSLLISRFGTHSQVLGHLARAVEYLLPDEEANEPEAAQTAVAPVASETVGGSDTWFGERPSDSQPESAPEAESKEETPKRTTSRRSRRTK